MLGVDAAAVPARAGRKAKEAPVALEVLDKLRLVQDFLIDAPVYTEKYGGRGNWLARITLDAMAPGGLDRKFCQRGKGACLYVIDELQLFDALEFAADTTSPHSSRKRTNRWFGVVIAKTDGYILVERWAKAVEAVLRSQDAKTNPKDRIRALQEQRDVLISEAAQIEAEIQELRRASENLVSFEPAGGDEVRRDMQFNESDERQGHGDAAQADVEANVARVTLENDIRDPEAAVLRGERVSQSD